MAEPARSVPARPGVDGDLGWGLGVIFRAYSRAATDVLSDVPGGPRGFQVLATAADQPHGSQVSVARKLGIDRTVMTYLLDDLEGAGLIRRTPDPNDRRARRLVVTDTGDCLLADMRQRLAEVEDHLLEQLSADEREGLRHTVRRVAVRLDGIDPVVDRCTLVEELDR
jgi:DNA-binding MarR family transcriptional regulator